MSFAESAFAQDPFNLNFRRGYYYLDIDNVKAIEFFDNAIVIDSTKAVTFYYRGIAHFKNQEPNKSIYDFDKAMQIDSGFYKLHIFKAFVYRSINKMDMAIESFNRYIEKDLNDTIDYSYFVRGKMKGGIGDYKGAIEDFNNALKQEPNFVGSAKNVYRQLEIVDLKKKLGHAEKKLKDVVEGDLNEKEVSQLHKLQSQLTKKKEKFYDLQK